MREKNIILSPSLLACDFARAGEQLAALERVGIRQIHLDVMDGIFVPNISFGQVVIRSLRKSTSLFFDTHLMITEPERYIDDFAAAGSDRITVHLESCADVGPALDRIEMCIRDSYVIPAFASGCHSVVHLQGFEPGTH